MGEKSQTFDFSKPEELAEATRFRDQEVPFIIKNVPAVEEVVKKWNFHYLLSKLQQRQVKVEISKSNHMMYWSHKHLRGGNRKKSWSPPTEISKIDLLSWLQKAQVPPEKQEGDITHYYFRMDAKGRQETRCVPCLHITRLSCAIAHLACLAHAGGSRRIWKECFPGRGISLLSIRRGIGASTVEWGCTES